MMRQAKRHAHFLTAAIIVVMGAGVFWSEIRSLFLSSTGERVDSAIHRVEGQSPSLGEPRSQKEKHPSPGIAPAGRRTNTASSADSGKEKPPPSNAPHGARDSRLGMPVGDRSEAFTRSIENSTNAQDRGRSRPTGTSGERRNFGGIRDHAALSDNNLVSTDQEPDQSGGHGLDGNLEGNYGISGQVLDENGRPVGGIEIVAALRRLFDQEGGEFKAGAGLERRAVTDGAGFFLFWGLPNGEYEIRTVAGDDYPTAANTVVRAGVDSVRLVVAGRREIWVDGYVTGARGEPLGGVEIFPSGSTEPAAISNTKGLFGFGMLVKDHGSYLVRLRADAYQEKKVSLTKNDWLAKSRVELYVSLEPARMVTAVSGIVRSSTGEPVGDETVYLQNQGKKHRGITDATGAFFMGDVESNEQYALWLMPEKPYGKYRREGLLVPPDGLGGLEIILEPLSAGSIAGLMIDTRGRPVPGFSLMVRSEDARSRQMQVMSNQAGFFRVDNVPGGRVRFESGSFPRFVVSGAQLPRGGEIDVDLILDIGDRRIGGRVMDSFDNAVAAADITLSWVLREKGLVHESLRKTASDQAGEFQFTQVSEEAHTVIVSAAGFKTARLEHEGRWSNEELVVRLESLPD